MPNRQAERVTACVVNWNTRPELERLLESIERYAPGMPTIVVDNASADGSAEMVRQRFAWVELIENPRNLGYAAANNQALKRVQTEFALLLNPDIELTKGGLEALVECIERHARAGAAAPRLVGPDGNVQLSCRSFPTPDVVFYELLGLSRLFPGSRRFGKWRMSWWDYADERTVDQPMASALLIRMAALRQVGLFDEGFPLFFNDVDLCLRLWRGGWEIWFCPRATFIHRHGAATSKVPLRALFESHRSFARFYAKHYRGAYHPLVYWSTIAALWLAFLARLPLAAARQLSVALRSRNRSAVQPAARSTNK